MARVNKNLLFGIIWFITVGVITLFCRRLLSDGMRQQISSEESNRYSEKNEKQRPESLPERVSANAEEQPTGNTANDGNSRLQRLWNAFKEARKDSQWWQAWASMVLVPVGVYAVFVYSSQLTQMKSATQVANEQRDAMKGQSDVMKGQLDEMQKSTVEATKAADAAKESSDTAKRTIDFARASAHLDQRAWVAPIEVNFGPPSVGSVLTVTVKAKNTGKTFAKNFKMYKIIEKCPKGKLPSFAYADSVGEARGSESSVTVLGPNGEYTSTSDVPMTFDGKPAEIVTQTQLDALKAEEASIFIYGKLTYIDVFKCDHWTTFCTEITLPSFKNRNYKEHNDADDNDCSEGNSKKMTN